MLSNLKNDLSKAEEHLHNEFNKLQVGRANPSLVEGIMINAYGSVQPLRNLAGIGIMDAQTISIQPWDKSILKDIDKGITDASLGLNPQNNGESILIKVPLLTEERRKELVKIARKVGEDERIAVRNIRHDYLKKIKQAETDKALSEDMAKDKETELQKSIDEMMKVIDEMLKHKEEDIMRI